MNKQFGGVRDVEWLQKEPPTRRTTPQERRSVLLPFFWSTVVKQGQIFGDMAHKAPNPP